MFWFIKPLRYLAGALRDLNSPRRIALGVALGMLVGLVPKDNLTAAALGVVLLTFRVNLAAGTGEFLARLDAPRAELEQLVAAKPGQWKLEQLSILPQPIRAGQLPTLRGGGLFTR